MLRSRHSPLLSTLSISLMCLAATYLWFSFHGAPAVGLIYLSAALCSWWFGWRYGIAALFLQVGVIEAWRVLGYFQPDADHAVRMLVAVGTGLGLVSLLHRARSVNEQLALASEKLRLAQESAEVWAWEYDPEKEIFIWHDSRHANDKTRHSSTKEILESMHPQDRAEVKKQMTQALDNGGEYRVEFRTTRRGRERWILSRGRVYEGLLSPRRVIGMNVDITARKRAEDSRVLAENARLTSELAHEINNSLEAAISATYLLGSDSPESRKPEYIEILQDSHEHIRAYVRRLVDSATAHFQ